MRHSANQNGCECCGGKDEREASREDSVSLERVLLCERYESMTMS